DRVPMEGGRRVNDSEGVAPPKPQRSAVEIHEDHVRLAARSQTLGEREAHLALEPGCVEHAPRRRPVDAGGAVVGVAAATREAREHQSGVSHGLQWYPSFGRA